MATQTSDNAFPLASEKPYGDENSHQSGSDIGASGDSSGNSISISQGGMIAIIVVVVVVVLLGGMKTHSFFRKSIMLTSHSLNRGPILCC